LLLARGEQEEGLDVLAGACRLAPQDPEPRRQLAEALLRLGRLPAARTNIDALRALGPAPGMLALLEAEYRLAGGEARAVLPDLKKLHEEWPDDYNIAFVLARCLEMIGMREEALAAYRRAANIEFRRKEPRLAMARLHMAGREDAHARSILEYLARYHPEDRDVLQPLLGLYYGQGYLERALRIGQRLLAIAPAETNVQVITGICFLRIEDPARRDLKKGVEMLWPRRLDEPRNRSLLEALHYGLLELNDEVRAAEVKRLFP
jgi:tetratricopeptide (TPR) repeat protein